MWGRRRLGLPVGHWWAWPQLFITVQEHLVGGGCQDLARLPGSAAPWGPGAVAPPMAGSSLAGRNLWNPPRPPLQMRNGISAQLCSAARAGWGVQTPLAEPSLLLLLTSTQMECCPVDAQQSTANTHSSSFPTSRKDNCSLGSVYSSQWIKCIFKKNQNSFCSQMIN